MLKGHYYEGKVEAGCDEAGRGCLAGSVFAAAVILPEGYQNELLNDSKQLTEKKRYQLREMIERDAVAWAVGVVTPEEIDKINILNASILAMHRQYRCIKDIDLVNLLWRDDTYSPGNGIALDDFTKLVAFLLRELLRVIKHFILIVVWKYYGSSKN